MKNYKKPEFHFVENNGGLDGNKLASLSDHEIKRYLKQDSYLEAKRKYRIKPGFALRKIAGEYTIIPVDSESLISNAMMIPNGSAVFLWRAFEEPSTVEDVVMKCLMEYEVSKEHIRKTVKTFVEESIRYGILEEAE